MQRGEAVAIREIKSLLNTEQQAWMDEEWARQQQLRLEKPARTAVAQAALGYMSKRDIQIEALQRACEEASGDQLNDLRQLQQQAVVRQGRIYLDTLSKKLAKGTDASKAKTIANNNLTRAGLARLVGAKDVAKDTVYASQVCLHENQPVCG